MANKSVFAAMFGKLLPRADTANYEGAPAYAYEPSHKLAQYAMTGCFNGTFYADAREQLDVVLELVKTVNADFIAKTAIYAREKGLMKDMPALLVAALSMDGEQHLTPAFGRVIDNGKMLRNFVQIMRSGAVGRKSLGSRPKRLVQAWLNGASDAQLIRAAVGRDPSLGDVIKMVHPKPKDAAREALFAYLIGRSHDETLLPEALRQFERFKKDRDAGVPEVPFQMLTALDLGRDDWVAIARNAGWQMLRMNLNTFERHGVFEVAGMAEEIAERLCDPKAIARARVFPYQIMVAYAMADKNVPMVVREALQDAMEVAIQNVPEVDGRVVVCPDVSGSMGSPATGYRRGATSVVRCIDVAALVAAAILRRNKLARVLPFEHRVVDVKINPRDSVMTNARKLASIGGGGTSCSAPLQKLNRERALVDLVIVVSDNQSWVDSGRSYETRTMAEWARLKRRNPAAKLVCIDITPYGTTQAQERPDVLNVGGFSDAVFDVIATYAKDEMGPDHWVGKIEEVEL